MGKFVLIVTHPPELTARIKIWNIYAEFPCSSDLIFFKKNNLKKWLKTCIGETNKQVWQVSINCFPKSQKEKSNSVNTTHVESHWHFLWELF